MSIETAEELEALRAAGRVHGALSAHVEHTLVITDGRPLLLTA